MKGEMRRPIHILVCQACGKKHGDGKGPGPGPSKMMCQDSKVEQWRCTACSGVLKHEFITDVDEINELLSFWERTKDAATPSAAEMIAFPKRWGL